MNHIDEGIAILRKLAADKDVIKAWILHPLFQTDLENFQNRNYGNLKLDIRVVTLGHAYRELANSFLPKDYRNSAPKVEPKEIYQMLLADKIQNSKDFYFNTGIEACRREELDIYFGKWRLALDRHDVYWSKMQTFISHE